MLPARFRAALENGCVLTKGQDECVFVWSTDDWQEEAERMKKLPRTDRRFRGYARSFFSGAVPQDLDGQGRVTIPHDRSLGSVAVEVKAGHVELVLEQPALDPGLELARERLHL